jgi:hypothetical protein
MKKIGIGLSLLLVFGVSQAWAQRYVMPIFLRIEGYVGEKPKDAPVADEWTVATDKSGDKYVKFYVTRMDVLTGDISYMDIFERLEPYTPTVQMNALPEEEQAFAGAPPQKKVTMRAYLRQSGTARILMVDYLDVQK